MLNVIREFLVKGINDIDTGNSNISESTQEKIIDIFAEINRQNLSKIQAANYIGVCRATFDNYVNNGWIPKGKKIQGVNNLFWNKHDLDKFLEKDKNCNNINN